MRELVASRNKREGKLITKQWHQRGVAHDRMLKYFDETCIYRGRVAVRYGNQADWPLRRRRRYSSPLGDLAAILGGHMVVVGP